LYGQIPQSIEGEPGAARSLDKELPPLAILTAVASPAQETDDRPQTTAANYLSVQKAAPLTGPIEAAAWPDN
jgi:hypothetical protein